MGHASRLRLVTKDQPREEEREQLQAFADQVESEEHWTRLKASAETDDARAELERVVGPMLRFRQARCHTPLCDSGLPPLYQPVLVVRKRPDDPPIWAPIEIRVCAHCKDEMGVVDVLTDDIWGQITRQCIAGGEPIPVRLLTALSFDRVM
jgi:hypothetical protein